jgi:hypothetical protein
MYPVGVLFGLGFDTASSIALLAVTAIAQRGTNGEGMPRSNIVMLPVSNTFQPRACISYYSFISFLSASFHGRDDTRRFGRLRPDALRIC